MHDGNCYSTARTSADAVYGATRKLQECPDGVNNQSVYTVFHMGRTGKVILHILLQDQYRKAYIVRKKRRK